MAVEFFDTNVLLYVVSADAVKASRAEALLRSGGTISVQVLNELANVARRKMGFEWPEVRSLIGTLRALLEVTPLDVATHDLGLHLCERYRFSIYDGMIVAAAIGAGCNILWSEDMQNGLRVEDRLTIRDPFTD
ncbi:PIN domain-containing protein [Novosphingobium colocasiae]|uniref:Ribonuclease VapC n=1 Tax=Novosphingobium colocasiae TaxID=1256513 RepID=A0A918PC94_9SPHN|nr:PIN domain-containing protein [Novosphingobium colocasiae]GGY97733.1 ribonuclease VapC [Novosphingobium colocasiae]